MEKISRKSLNFYGKTLSLFLLSFFSCGLPTRDDYAPPPQIIGGGNEQSFVQFRLTESKGFVVYYKTIREGTSEDEVFTNTSTTGENVFRNRGYYKSVVKSTDTFFWSPNPATTFPVLVMMDYKNVPSNGTIDITVTDNSSVIENFRLQRYDESKFNAMRKGDNDAGGQTGGTVSLAIAAMNFSLNPSTLNLNPSVGVFMSYIRGVTLN